MIWMPCHVSSININYEMEEEFKVVKRKRKKTKPCHVVGPNISEDQATTCMVADIEKVVARLKICKRELEESCFWLKFKESVARSLAVASRSYKCQQTLKKGESQNEQVVPCILDRNLQDDLSSLTINNRLTNNCKNYEKNENLTNHCHAEDADNDTNKEHSSGSKSQYDVQELSRDDGLLDEVRMETKQDDQNQAADSMMQDCFSVDGIVCYGLGNFSSCINARYQLVLLLLLIDYFKITPSRCFCYDPVFTPAEHDILKGYGLSCLEYNEEGKRRVDKPTIFYMPHCGKPLYNNLLWSNWGNALANLIIIGNSFQQLEERFPSKLLEEEVPYIKAILPFTHQFDVVNNFKFLDIFNDIGVHVFPTSALLQAPPTLWTSKKEPSYSHLTDVEIIVNKS